MTESETEFIYLDHNATTPVDPQVFDAMSPYLRHEFGNPSSGYLLGIRAKEGVNKARREVAELIGCRDEEILFTSGGSESNNTVLKGLIDFTDPGRAHIITSAVEHPAILNTALYLTGLGVKVTFLPVDRYGVVDPDAVEQAIGSGTTLITIMLANNETGTIQPVREISKIARRHHVPFHTDAAQAIGKMEVNVDELGVDLLTIAGHKLYCPKGIGALYIRRGLSLTPLIHGAAQEAGRRAGTENTMLVSALGAACHVAKRRLKQDVATMELLRDRLEDILFSSLEGIFLNGHPTERLPNTLNVALRGLEGRRILEEVPKIMASTGAACHDRTITLSHVLSAMHVSPEIGMGAIRLTIGRSNNVKQIEEAAQMLIACIKRMQHGRPGS
jgi:cysteine desulfurase